MPQANCSLGELMKAVYRIGNRIYPKPGERLFAHHMGDGFAIVGDSHECSLVRPISIAIALMRCVASTGMFASAAIAEGKFADILSWYPQEAIEHTNFDRTIPLGHGTMTLLPVMGTAFIAANRLHKNTPSGPFLTVCKKYEERIPLDFFCVKDIVGKRKDILLSIDWIRSRNPILTNIQKGCDLPRPSPEQMVQEIKKYCSKYQDIGEKWCESLGNCLDIAVD